MLTPTITEKTTVTEKITKTIEVNGFKVSLETTLTNGGDKKSHIGAKEEPNYWGVYLVSSAAVILLKKYGYQDIFSNQLDKIPELKGNEKLTKEFKEIGEQLSGENAEKTFEILCAEKIPKGYEIAFVESGNFKLYFLSEDKTYRLVRLSYISGSLHNGYYDIDKVYEHLLDNPEVINLKQSSIPSYNSDRFHDCDVNFSYLLSVDRRKKQDLYELAKICLEIEQFRYSEEELAARANERENEDEDKEYDD